MSSRGFAPLRPTAALRRAGRPFSKCVPHPEVNQENNYWRAPVEPTRPIDLDFNGTQHPRSTFPVYAGSVGFKQEKGGRLRNSAGKHVAIYYRHNDCIGFHDTGRRWKWEANGDRITVELSNTHVTYYSTANE